MCPNISNPAVAREFNELKAAVGKKAAYAIWSLNNGNAIDKAPNGAESKLFSDLLQRFNGDRQKSIKAKSKVYTNSFRKRFGDWIENPSQIFQKNAPTSDEQKEWVEKNKNALIDRYIQRHGNVYDADAVRDMLEPIGYDRSNVIQFKSGEILLGRYILDELIDRAKDSKKGSVTIITGAIGSGKNFVLNQKKQQLDEKGVVFNTTLNSFTTTQRMIEFFKERGLQDVEVIAIHNDIETTVRNSIERGKQEGRFVPLLYMISSYRRNAGKIKALNKSYPKMRVTTIDNSGNQYKEVTNEESYNWDYDVDINLVDRLIDVVNNYTGIEQSVKATILQDALPLQQLGEILGIDITQLNDDNQKRMVYAVQTFLKNFSITLQDMSSYNGDVPLFDALERIVNIKTADDITDGVGYVIAFMMQYHPAFRQIVDLEIMGSGPTVEKSLRRLARKDKELKLHKTHDRIYNKLDRDRYMHIVGKEIAKQLKKFYNIDDSVEQKKTPFIVKIWNIITDFFSKFNSETREQLFIAKNFAKDAAYAIATNDASFVRWSAYKPGSEGSGPSIRVDIAEALRIFPYEESIVTNMSNEGIGVAGGASIAVAGVMLRPSENPLHDLDFSAADWDLESLDQMLGKYYENHELVNTIQGSNSATYTFLILDRPFKIQKPKFPLAAPEGKESKERVIIDANTGEVLGRFYDSELFLKPDVQGKFLDFFTGQDAKIDVETVKLNGKSYKFASYKRAMQAKIEWQRPKDVWDYANFQLNKDVKETSKLLDQNGEPTIQQLDLNNNAADSNNQTYHDFAIYLEQHRRKYVEDQISKELQENTDMTDDEIIESQSRHTNEWAEERRKEIVGEAQLKLAEAFGFRQLPDGTFESDDDSVVGKMRIQFVNSLGDNAGEIDMALHIISIGMDGADATTFNHELAHLYVRKFWNSELIQKALKLYSKKGMTDTEREEALVDAITEMSVDNYFENTQEGDFNVFWNAFNEMIFKVFGITNKVARRKVTELVTRSFIVNEQLAQQDLNNRLYTMYEGPMFQSKQKVKRKQLYTQQYLGRSDEQVTSNIINFTVSKESSAKRFGRLDTNEMLNLQAQVLKIKKSAERISEAVAANNIIDEMHNKANLIIQFIEDSAYELKQYASMLKVAEADRYRSVAFDIDKSTGNVVYSERGSQRRVLSDHDIIRIKTDIVDFYRDIFASINTMLNDASVSQKFDSADMQEIIAAYRNSYASNLSDDISAKFEQIVRMRTNEHIDTLVDAQELTDEQKFRLKVNMRKWMDNNQFEGDISSWEIWFGMASHSKSPLIAAFQTMLQYVLDEVENESNAKGDELMAQLRKARRQLRPWQRLKFGFLGFRNIQKIFLEKTNRGLPTGYFITSHNRGQYEQDREDFIADILYGKNGIVNRIRELKDDAGNLLFDRDPITGEQFDIEFDKFNNPIFPEHEKVEPLEKEYRLKFEDFEKDRKIRRYTHAYYVTRIKMLSVPTLRKVENLYNEIAEIRKSATIGGKFMNDRLTTTQRELLKSYQDQLDQLYDFYNPDGTLKDPSSEEYKIAQELFDFQTEVNAHVKRITDQKSFDEARDIATDKTLFDELNTHWIVNPKHREKWAQLSLPFIEQLKQIPGKGDSEDIKKYESLLQRRSKLIGRIKLPGFNFPELDKWWDSEKTEFKFPQIMREIKSLDQQIDKLKAKIVRDNKKLLKRPSMSQIQKARDMYRDAFVPYDPSAPIFNVTTLSWYQKIKNDIISSNLSTDEKNNLLDLISDGGKPLSIFKIRYPLGTLDPTTGKRGNGIDVNGQPYEMFIKVPDSQYTKVDVDNSDDLYVDKRFVDQTGKSFQLSDMYKNKVYDKYIGGKDAPSEVKKLYELQIETMKEAWSKIPFLGDYDYRLPQQKARTSTAMFRRKNIFKSAWNELNYWFNPNELDVDINDDYEMVPDGRGGMSRRQFVPIRYVKRLEHPEYISSDLVHTVQQFYEMAVGYQNKTAALPILQLFQQRLNSNGSTRQAQKLEQMLNIQMFGKETVSFKDSKDEKPNSKWHGRILKAATHTRAATMLGLLAWNIMSGFVSFADPLLSMIADVTTGKYNNFKDFGMALWHLFINSPKALYSLGKVNVSHLEGALMQKFQLVKTNASKFNKSDMTQLERFLTDGLSMKIFTVGDYTMNAIEISMALNNMRQYTYKNKHGDTVSEYLTKENYIKRAIKDGNTAQEANNMYKHAKKMRSAYKVKNGQAIKDDTVSNVDEMRLKHLVKSRVSIYNGIVPDAEHAMLQTNVWFRFMTMLRNFFITGFVERFKSQQHFILPGYDPQDQDRWMDQSTGDILIQNPAGIDRDAVKRMQNEFMGGYNFDTRSIENGVFTSFKHVVSNTLPYIKYALFIMNPARRGIKHYEERKEARHQGFTNRKGQVVTISETDIYALNKMLTEIGIIALLLVGTFLMHKRIKEPDKEPSYAELLIYLAFIRLTQERGTWYNPTTFFDIITTVSTSYSDLKRKFRVVNALNDLLGLTGHEPTEVINRGIYKGHQRWVRDIAGLTSSFGTHNLISSIGVHGIESKINYYDDIAPFYAKWIFADDKNKSKAKKNKSKDDKKSKKSSSRRGSNR